MYKLPEVLEALRNADSAGNTEDAQKLAVIADRIRKNTPTPQNNSGGGMMPYVNRGIAETVGGIPDLIRGGLNLIPGVELPEAVGGRKSIEGAMRWAGIQLPQEGRPPEAIPEHMGAVVGQVAGLLNPSTVGIKGLARGANLTGKVANSVWQSMVKHPYLTMTSEVTGGMSSGAARGGAQKAFPDSPGTQTALEVGAGLAGSLAPTALVHTPTAIAIRTGKNILYKVALPFTKKGGTYRAGEFIKGLTSNPAEAAKRTAESTISDLPPAVASGEKKIIAAYKGLVGQDPVSDADAIEKLTGSIIKLEGEMRKFGYGSPELLEEITRKRVAAIELKMDRRVLDASTTAQKRLESIPVAKRKAAESRIVRNELDTARQAANADVNKAWSRVNKDIPVGFENTRKTYQSLYNDLGVAQRVDIPSSLKSSPILKKKPPTKNNVREMQSLRSKLLETARIARKEGQWNKARIAEDVSDAILVDIEQSASPEFADLKAALSATKQYKMRFESGETGRILGYSRSGAPAMNPDLTLDMTIGRMGQKGAIDVNNIVVSPEARNAAKRYLARSFTDYADPTNSGINTVKANRWIRTNEALLDEFPGLKKQLSDANSAQEFANNTKLKMQARKKALQDPRISESARFLNRANMGQEISGILKSKRPTSTAMELVRQARKDPTGKALGGLRAGFVDDMLTRSKFGPFNDLGEQTLSGRALLNYINKNEPTLRSVFDNNQISRMKRIGSELSRIETFDKTTAGKPDLELKDSASMAIKMAARLLGARVGGKIGSGSMGGSLQYASIFSSRAQKFITWLSKDTAQQLVSDAILSKDPALLNSLLKPLAKPLANKTDIVSLNKNLNLWLSTTGKRVYDDMVREEQQGE